MNRIIIVSQDGSIQDKLASSLPDEGYLFTTLPYSEDVLENIAGVSASLVLIDTDNRSMRSGVSEICNRIRNELKIPVMVIVTSDMFADKYIFQDGIDDFIVKQRGYKEMAVRLQRVLKLYMKKDLEECIVCGDLIIDLARCEVTISGKVVVLTFMEYELLKYLANNKGRVLTRDVLLNNVWGYDYFGGDRTVDVHIRRLRSKIEDPDHEFIETVRNIGYRFKENS